MKYNTITGQVSERVPAGVYDGVDWKGEPPKDVAARAGWVDVTPEIQAQIDAQEEAEFEARLAATVAFQQAAFQELVAALTPFVQSIQRNLVTLGYTLPNNGDEVMALIMARSMADELSPDEESAKINLGLVYGSLKQRGVTDEQINAVWEAINVE